MNWIGFCKSSFILALFAVHLGLLSALAWLDAPMADEPGQIAAGLSHLRLGRFSLFNVNPPLARVLAALPLEAVGVSLSWDGYSEEPGVRSEFPLGARLFDQPLSSLRWMIFSARWSSIAFSLLGAYVVYRWSRECFGSFAAIVALITWSFDPNVLTWGHVVTSDMQAASLSIAAGYLFWKWSRSKGRNSWSAAGFNTGLVVAAIALGLALLSKFTSLVLVVILPILWLLSHGCASRNSKFKCAAAAAVSIAIAWLVLSAGYAFERQFTRLGDFEFISAFLGGQKPFDQAFAQPRNRFQGSAWAAIAVPLPANYLQGIDHIKWEFEEQKTSYLNGEIRRGGWWYYYLVGVAVKTPVGTLALLLITFAVFASVHTYRESWRDETFLLVPSAVMFALVSSQTGFSHHLRYVLPAYPFAIVWCSRLGARAESVFESRLQKTAIVLAALSSISSLWCFPHCMSYFNEFAGGPLNGHRYLVDSNLDWGQDMYRLGDWVQRHPDADPLYGALTTPLDPSIFEATVAPIPASEGPYRLPLGWYAVSAHKLRTLEDMTEFLELKPIDRCGYSIYIYHVTPQDVDRLRRERNLPPSPDG